MYLKEAFRYQNFLNRMIGQASSYLGNTAYTMRTTQEHLRKKTNPEAEDETTDLRDDLSFPYSANDLVHFLYGLLGEKKKLTAAITEAKRRAGVDIDGELAVNQVRQGIADVFSSMAALRPSERKTRGTDYKFNADGAQVPYYYDIKEVSTIDFDRRLVKALSRGISKEADDISAAVDRAMVSTLVDYTAPIDVNDTFEEAMEDFADWIAAAPLRETEAENNAEDPDAV